MSTRKKTQKKQEGETTQVLVVQPEQVLPLTGKVAIENPISDDNIDLIESMAQQLNDTPNMSEKITMHAKLTTVIEKLKKEIETACEIIDNIDVNDADKRIGDVRTTSKIMPDIDIDESIVNIETLFNSMKEEEVMQYKIDHFKHIADIVKACKDACGSQMIMKVKNCT